jgi:hypothetical protein
MVIGECMVELKLKNANDDMKVLNSENILFLTDIF